MKRGLTFWLLAAFLCAAAGLLTAQVQPGFQSVVTTANITYYICAKANGGTCVYNGDSGTVAPTISDNNECLRKAAPCATFNGVATKLTNKIIDSLITIQLADTAGTGTDCYRPNNTIFNTSSVGRNLDSSLQLEEGAVASGQYPNSYLYILGNTTTPSSVKVTGATTCSGTTATDTIGLLFSATVVRTRGFQIQYFTNTGTSTGNDLAAIMAYNSYVYAEDMACVGDPTTTTQMFEVFNHSVIRWGNSVQSSITQCDLFVVANFSHGSFGSPIGRSNIAITVGNSWAATGGLFLSNEKSHIGIAGLNLTVDGTGTGTAIVWFAIAGSSITWNDDSTFIAPTQTISYQGAGLTVNLSTQHSYIGDTCRTLASLVCNVGNTSAIGKYAQATFGSYVFYFATATVTTADTTATGSYVEGPAVAISEVANSNFLVSTSTLTKTDATLATVVGLSQALVAGRTYNCHGHLNGVSGSAGGIKVALVATNSLTATSARFTGFTWNGTTAVAQTTVTALASNIAANTAVYSDIYIDGSITVNVAGTINVQAAQNVTNGTATTVLLGSTFSCVRTN